MAEPLYLDDIQVPPENGMGMYALAEQQIIAFVVAYVGIEMKSCLKFIMTECWKLPGVQTYLSSKHSTIIMKEASIHAAIAKAFKKIAFEFIPEVNRRF